MPKDPTTPKTSLFHGIPGEEPIELDKKRPQNLSEAGGDTAGNEMDANVGGASATAGQDSGGAVGVRRGLSVGKAGSEYQEAPEGETDSDVETPSDVD